MESIKSLWWCPWKNHEQGRPPLRRRGFIKSTPPEGWAAQPSWWLCLLGLCVVCFGLVVVCRQYERNPIRLYVLCLYAHIRPGNLSVYMHTYRRMSICAYVQRNHILRIFGWKERPIRNLCELEPSQSDTHNPKTVVCRYVFHLYAQRNHSLSPVTV